MLPNRRSRSRKGWRLWTGLTRCLAAKANHGSSLSALVKRGLIESSPRRGGPWVATATCMACDLSLWALYQNRPLLDQWLVGNRPLFFSHPGFAQTGEIRGFDTHRLCWRRECLRCLCGRMSPELAHGCRAERLSLRYQRCCGLPIARVFILSEMSDICVPIMH
jgi:hypothetical protein